MAAKPKKAKTKKSTPRKAPTTPEETKDLSLDDLESVSGGIILQAPTLTPTMAKTVGCLALDTYRTEDTLQTVNLPSVNVQTVRTS
ncbi:MAG: hypothetical protein FIA95_16730 [Gemmatimonadetes bacterium]|nr:hypothetical protein [Gemmatimonadota bacterium]